MLLARTVALGVGGLLFSIVHRSGRLAGVLLSLGLFVASSHGGTHSREEIMAARESIVSLENLIATETARLQTVYSTLSAKHARLDKSNVSAVLEYNKEAEAYASRKVYLTGLRAKLAEQQAALQSMLDQPAGASSSPTRSAAKAAAPVAGKPAAPGQITLYLRKGNPAVTMARAYLSGRRFTYREVDVDASETNKREWSQYGTTIPTIVIDGQVVQGFVRSELDRLLPTGDEDPASFD